MHDVVIRRNKRNIEIPKEPRYTDLRNTSTPFKGVRKGLTNTLLDGYETARYGTAVFGLSEYLRYQEALSELATVVKVRNGRSQRQHQSAAKT
ncbi:hypothetical protein AB1E18_010530 [Capra hircus]